MRVIFAGGGTGGHLYPGLAIARAIARLDPGADLLFVGARRGIEARVLPESGFRHVLLDLYPLFRRQVWKNLETAGSLVDSWLKVGDLMRANPPSVVVGLGGYASGVTLAWSVAHRIPIVQQAGDSIPGLAARIFSRWSRVLYVGFPEAVERLPRSRRTDVVITGNPIEPPPSPRPSKAASLVNLGFPGASGRERVVLVFGGSQGSFAINEAVDDWVGRGLPADVRVIWATGSNRWEEYRQRESSQVVVKPYLSPISDAYAACDLAVTRAGAMTCAELAAWGIPAIMIPLPSAAADHQTGNARAVEAGGAGVLLPERDLSASSLSQTVLSLLGDQASLASMSAAARDRGRSDAAETIARDILARFT
ncbi:MAG: UDP-N-acetylglucosamine--N-acetylmuramyl-(pentapeptide) pyrophosphoryl-undecaprenol N-acetylglucosamine transferase [Gemmatimonadetes bacterium]|nr:UDP-N-acetylglucosamine--N-acetylmuramyl-(pentapeptide) pyrophosphoryl-undecaprenol N-acetylglucosamine transferase [Gemmatimonadota bacterium]